MRGACLTENLLYYARISCDDETYKPKLYKGICETTFNAERTRTILNYLPNTGSWQIRNFTHGYPGV